MKFLRILIFFITLLLQFAAKAQSTKVIKLVFHTMVGNSPLQLDSNYATPFGDTFCITKFKFFISHILFTNYSNAQQNVSKYFLVDESDSTSQTITLEIPDKPFSNLEFDVGVDSTKNVSGVQTGALDPATGMFWTWNSGYIMAKLEGKSPQSKAPFGNITYHIGGFRQKDNAVRKISLPIPDSKIGHLLNIGNQTHGLRSTSYVTIDINVDLNKWFDGSHPIKISEKSFCMSPGKMATEIADNYANMFSIKSISLN